MRVLYCKYPVISSQNPIAVPPIRIFLLVVFAALLIASCREPQPFAYSIQQSLITDTASVVSAHPLASDVGLAILKEGGNAIDAAIAVQFALAVVYPRAGNIGGGGFMVIRTLDGDLAALDYREKAPAAAQHDMYLDEDGNVADGLSTKGHLASGVPGTVSGMVQAHERYGRLPWASLVLPAVKLAREGYQLSPTEAQRLNDFAAAFREFNTTASPFLLERDWVAGDMLVQEDLANTLQRIADQGREGFYSGETATFIVEEMQQGKGLITAADLQAYKAEWREPIVGQYRDYRIISMPPPSSGGIALMQLLKMTDPYDLEKKGFQSVASVHTMVEAMRRVYADRAMHLGEMDFYEVPIDTLLNDGYLARRMASFRPDTVTRSDSIQAGNFRVALESFETTHTSIVDGAGNAVSVTTTLNSNFGSKVIVDGAGFFLNNEMDDFSAKPGVPNQFGLLGAEANAIAPGKRMLSSMTPTIVEKNGELFMVLGAPGGSTIITAVYQVLVNVTDYGMTIDSAVVAPRFHHQWLPDEIMVEPGAIDSLVRIQMEAMGHTFNEVSRMAVVKAILRLPDGRLKGAGDPRNPDDDVAGY